MAKKLHIITISLIILVITLTSFGTLAQHPGGGTSSEDTMTVSFNGYVAVGESWEKTVEFTEGSISKVEFALTWTDDEGSDSDPDTLILLTTDGMHEPKSGEGSNGMVMVTWEEDMLNDTWSMVVTCESAGPTQVPFGFIGVISQEESDPGNSFSLDVTFTYSEDGGGGPPPHVQAVLDSPVFKAHIAFMVASVFLFLGTGIAALAYLTRNSWGKRVSDTSSMKRIFSNPKPLVFIVLLAWLVFFIAAVPLGMWVAGMYYGWSKAWTGIPALWNPEAFEMTNADNVSFVVLALWALPMYINRAWVVKGKRFAKIFGGIFFLMDWAKKAPPPKLTYREFAICYFLMGIFIFIVFEVQPHGGG